MLLNTHRDSGGIRWNLPFKGLITIAIATASSVDNVNNDDDDESDDDRSQKYSAGVNIAIFIQSPSGSEGEDDEPYNDGNDNEP
jgi:hypothetical protein